MKIDGKIKEYIKRAFGWEIEFQKFDLNSLPYMLLEGAAYSLIICEGFKGIAIKLKSEDNLRMAKNIAQNIERLTHLKPVLLLESIDSYRRLALTQNHIGFIVADKQIYLPALGVWMSERGIGIKSNVSASLSPVATALVLMHLSGGSLQEKSVTEVAEIMGYSVKTLSLAFKELEQNKLISIIRSGRKKILHFNLTRSQLWEKLSKVTESPIEKRGFTSNIRVAKEIGLLASDSALAEVSMLAAPSQPIYAVYARDPRLKELDLNPHDGEVGIEIWKFDPKMTARNGMVDPFSLALSYGDEDDPRVRKEINTLIEKTL